MRLYARWLDRWQADPDMQDRRRAPERPTVGWLCERYNDHAASYYVKGGKQTSQVYNVRSALERLAGHYSERPADSLTLRDMVTLRGAMDSPALSRRTVNDYLGIVRRAYQWAAERGMIPAEVAREVRQVRNLSSRDASGARESDRILPVALADVEATVEHLPPILRALVWVQYHGGMRPGEACQMRTGDIEQAGEVWLYRPGSHKTEHHGRERLVALGPRAQEWLTPWLRLELDAPIFDPRLAMRWRYDQCKTHRRRPVEQPKTARRIGRAYNAGSYRLAVVRACKDAGVSAWHPNQLRHARATEVRRQRGLEAAQLVLGHAAADVTQIYAERDLAALVEIARATG